MCCYILSYDLKSIISSSAASYSSRVAIFRCTTSSYPTRSRVWVYIAFPRSFVYKAVSLACSDWTRISILLLPFLHNINIYIISWSSLWQTILLLFRCFICRRSHPRVVNFDPLIVFNSFFLASLFPSTILLFSYPACLYP